jgi:uncharacterized SAM-binding protein YcdF (DUF218 family)
MTSYNQGIVVLDGQFERIKALPKILEVYPKIPIFISAGLRYMQRNLEFLKNSGVDLKRVVYDCKATDTVTNFTTLLDELEKTKISKVYLVTSAYHMPRAKAISFIVLGSRGIVVEPIPLFDTKKSENPLKVIRDIVRAIIWLFTGYTGADLDPSLNEYQKRQLRIGGCPE